MRWPYGARIPAAHAWGALSIGTAGLIGVPTIVATLNSTDRHLRWWWPTNWMLLPSAIFVVGLLLLMIPLRRSKPGDIPDATTGPGTPREPFIAGEIDVDHVSGQAVAVHAKTIKGGEVRGKAKAQRVDEGASLRGVDVDHIG